MRLVHEHLGLLPVREAPQYPCRCLMWFRRPDELASFSRFYGIAQTPEILRREPAITRLLKDTSGRTAWPVFGGSAPLTSARA